jgi:hypothetical protein
MKTICAAALLIGTVATAQAHDWITGLRNRDGFLCCGSKDCTPIDPARVTPTSGGYFLQSYKETVSVQRGAAIARSFLLALFDLGLRVRRCGPPVFLRPTGELVMLARAVCGKCAGKLDLRQWSGLNLHQM